MSKEFSVGDKVIIKRSGKTYSAKIKRITKTLYITNDNFRFNKKTLRLGGYSGLFGRIIQNPTQEILDVIEKENCINKLQNVNWERLTLKQLKELIEYVGKQEGE